ncbi:MAG TPA: galactokinase, partial [Longimicrobiales bacterium]
SIYSLDFNEQQQFDLDNEALVESGWLRYVHAMACALQDAGHTLHGWEGVTAGNVPIGAGLSSSAAIELAAARAFAATANITWNARTMALLAQRAENVWVGVNCGIMDQMISAAGEDGCALLIDCRSLETRSMPMPRGTAVVIMDTATRRGLVDSEYNERRQNCEAAARILGVRALRDVDVAMFEARARELEPVMRRRARHVITENERTLHAVDALYDGDATLLGRLMNESHESLRDDFEVSRPELNIMVELARKHVGCYGARMTGAGFGGCAVALVANNHAEDFVTAVAQQYSREVGLTPALYVCTAAAGASVAVNGQAVATHN